MLCLKCGKLWVSLGTSGTMRECDIVSNGEASCEELYNITWKDQLFISGRLMIILKFKTCHLH